MFLDLELPHKQKETRNNNDNVLNIRVRQVACDLNPVCNSENNVCDILM